MLKNKDIEDNPMALLQLPGLNSKYFHHKVSWLKDNRAYTESNIDHQYRLSIIRMNIIFLTYMFGCLAILVSLATGNIEYFSVFAVLNIIFLVVNMVLDWRYENG